MEKKPKHVKPDISRYFVPVKGDMGYFASILARLQQIDRKRDREDDTLIPNAHGMRLVKLLVENRSWLLEEIRLAALYADRERVEYETGTWDDGLHAVLRELKLEKGDIDEFGHCILDPGDEGLAERPTRTHTYAHAEILFQSTDNDLLDQADQPSYRPSQSITRPNSEIGDQWSGATTDQPTPQARAHTHEAEVIGQILVAAGFFQTTAALDQTVHQHLAWYETRNESIVGFAATCRQRHFQKYPDSRYGVNQLCHWIAFHAKDLSRAAPLAIPHFPQLEQGGAS
jgi:hypothetical protein